VSTLLSAALAAAERGWPVFPCRPGTKRPALHAETSCRRTGPCADGHAKPENRATTDPDRIRACWATGEFNIGLATGPAGLVVVDCDIPKPGATRPPAWNLPGIRDGRDVLAVLADHAGADLADALASHTVRTRHGGWHLYYGHPDLGTDRARLHNTAGDRGGLGWCIDTRAWGGYVLATGSVVPPDPGMPGPGRYEVIEDGPPTPMPSWMADILTAATRQTAMHESAASAGPLRDLYSAVGRRSAYAAAALRGEVDAVLAARPGQRNHTINAAAYALGQLVGAGLLPEHLAAEALRHAAAVHVGVDRFTTAEADAAIRSGLTAGQRSPRRVPA
jgi:hypothetical protein